MNVNPFQVTYGASNYTYPGFNIGGLKQKQLTLSFASNSQSQHQIISIQVKTVGFTAISLKPNVPITIPAQAPFVEANLLLQAPFLGYTGDLEILVVTQ